MKDSSQAITESKDRRYARYKELLTLWESQRVFQLAKLKQESNETPQFISRVFAQLIEQGWLVSETNESDCYQWNVAKGSFPIERWIDSQLYGSQITASPLQDRPRERLLAYGPEKLKTAELLAILIRSGRPGESAVDAGSKLSNVFQTRLADLPSAGRGELKEISKAVEKTAYCQIMAGIELGRRVAEQSQDRVVNVIRSSDEAIAFCEIRFARLCAVGKQEEFHIVTLNTKNHVIDSHCITVGTLDSSLVHPREVFRPAIRDAAASILLVHNHPSGDPTPSPQDHSVTERLTKAGEIVGINVLDHIVLGFPDSLSIRAQ